MTDQNAKLYEHLEYFPFGETWVEEHSNTQRTPYLFTGKELDEETQLYYYGARYYDPRTSVWQSADPLLEKYLPSDGSADNLPGMGGAFNSKNLGLYSYAHLNPVRYADPDGKESVSTMIDNAATGCGPVSCAGYAALTAVYQVGTMGFASVHDPMRDAYDRGEATGGEYVKVGIGGGAAAAIASYFGGKWAGQGLGALIGRFASSPVFGFASQKAFQSFSSTLRSGLAKAGFGDVKAFMQGSAATGRNSQTGAAFDAGRVSDFDVALAGQSLFEKAKSLGIGLRGGGTRTGPLTSAEIEKLGLGGLRETLQGQTGREVNFMVYRDAAGATGRGPSVPIE